MVMPKGAGTATSSLRALNKVHPHFTRNALASGVEAAAGRPGVTGAIGGAAASLRMGRLRLAKEISPQAKSP